MKPGASPRILEIGCGSGGNFPLLQSFGQLEAVECDGEALALARARGVTVHEGSLPRNLPQAGVFDLVVLLDVLEHVVEDVPSVAAIAGKLAPGGRLLVTVPAMPWLWSAHDKVHHHQRRYTRTSLRAAIAEGGLEVEKIGYFNTLLFPMAVFNRALKQARGDDSGDDHMPSPLVNRSLQMIFSSEKHLVGRVPMPFGLSLFTIARRG